MDWWNRVVPLVEPIFPALIKVDFPSIFVSVRGIGSLLFSHLLIDWRDSTNAIVLFGDLSVVCRS